MASLEPNAVLLLKNSGFSHDTQIFSVAYQRLVNNLRPDVTVVSDGGVFSLPAGVKIEQTYLDKDFSEQQEIITQVVYRYAEENARPFYTLFPASAVVRSGLTSNSNGLAYLNLDARQADREPGRYFLDQEGSLSDRPAGRDFLASYYYTKASLLLRMGEFKLSQDLLIRAIELDEEPFSAEYKLYLENRSKFLTAN